MIVIGIEIDGTLEQQVQPSYLMLTFKKYSLVQLWEWVAGARLDIKNSSSGGLGMVTTLSWPNKPPECLIFFFFIVGIS